MSRASHLGLCALLAIGLSGCSGSIIPQGGSASSAELPPPPRPSERPSERPIERPSDRPADQAARPIPSTPVAPRPAPVASGDGTIGASLGVVAGPSFDALRVTDAKARAALASFRTSCPGLRKRTDQSGLTRAGDWDAACAAAGSAGDARRFFAENFTTVQVGDGKAFVTGYFEPEIDGSRTERPGYVPVYGRPRDLVDVDLGQFSDALKGKSIRGKVQGSSFVPYDDRTAIEQGKIDGRAPILAWAKDDIEFFFLQVQGSGRLKLPDGGVMRIGYASQNGRDYTGIGKLMKDRGLLGPGQTSMQGIVAWLRANPEEGKAIMRENKSFVFFRELTGAGPLGAMGYPVVGGTSLATDPAFVPLGAPVWLSLDRAEPNGLWIAQDTGGAIKGSNRFDSFWGAGAQAAAIAGGMSARGSAVILLPKAAARRLGL